MKYRDNKSEKTLLLVHGLAGESVWQPLVKQLLAFPALDGWDIHSFEYISQWWPRLVRLGVAWNPPLSKVANQLCTYSQTHLGHYTSISILAHSAGGLVVQQALLECDWLRDRTRDVGLFGTPSGGMAGKRIFGLFNPQIRDLLKGSLFLKELRKGLEMFTHMRSFSMRIVASLDDNIVPSEIVFDEFPKSMWRTVPGDHISMIQPTNQEADVFGVIVNLLLKPRIFLSYVHEDEARVLEVYRVLDRNEFAPWIDQRNIEPGRYWETAIREALQESDRFLVFLSNRAIEKFSEENSVFRQEVEMAIEMDKARDTPFLIPIRIEDCVLPQMIEKYQWFDLWSKNAEQLAKFLDLTIGSPRVRNEKTGNLNKVAGR